MARAGCPGRDILAAFLAGRLSGEAIDSVARHLDACPACQALAQAASPDADPLVAALCRPGPAGSYHREAGCDRALARLRARAAVLDEVTAGGPGVRREVEQLVREHVRAGAFPEWPVATLAWPATEHPDAVIGPYKLLEQIGEGGMGLV